MCVCVPSYGIICGREKEGGCKCKGREGEGCCGGEGVEEGRRRNKLSLHSLLASLEVAKSRTSLTDNSSELWPFTLNKG